ncbi:ZYRO0D07810p [Zygosaccharomyces rouxii]|uniref:ZYRO0D07810p n=1 Tax=Zygosaccharomyces rouxii (strain ATCC 2623 / CBS 732 / NBRC 1130 / NCYC 568 / NRRL Y-229) TaxID=559307 RepID=C5DVM1_ZYGRC|nr:uncharacterized protein ZYRO0D07810g [Zygosaccharomyces rouxii]KAH9200752.1 hypothetical protein LQ764DRAFT_99130 [Zygosaccharomyces rouxii]CAR27840.1 ZYRO0D07810p [Zygosaccharomyces rouxii]
MPQRRHSSQTKLPFSGNAKINVESCPNSFVFGSEPRDKRKRTQKYESSPIPQVSYDEKSTSIPILNVSRNHTNSQGPEYHIPVKSTPSGKVKSYCQGRDSMLQQYTFMTYSSGPMLNSMYQNYNLTTTMPYPMHYSSYPINMQPSHSANPNINLNMSKDQSSQTFPSFFNPRTAHNMPHMEKVNSWIENIPVFQIDEQNWKSECYDSSFAIDWEEEEFEDPLLAESNKISFATHDELLFLQAKKFETAIRKLYRLENEPSPTKTDFLVDTESFTDYL